MTDEIKLKVDKFEAMRQPDDIAPISSSGLLAVVALRNLTRRETVECNAHQGYTKDFHYIQYQTSDGAWHDLQEVFEDATAQTANDKGQR